MNSRKGSLEGILPMLALLILSAALAVQGIPIADAIEELALEATGDITQIAETRSRAEHVIYHYTPLAATYAANDAAYEQGRYSGGISWDSIPEEPEDLHQELLEAWEQESDRQFENSISNVFNCALSPGLQLGIYPSEDTEELFNDEIEDLDIQILPEGSTTGSNIEFRCGDTDRVIFREPSYKQEHIIENNRYAELAKYAAKFYTDIDSEFESTELEDQYSGSGQVCGAEANAEEQALSDARSEAYEKYESDVPNASNISSIEPVDGIDMEISQENNADEFFSAEEGDECSCECRECDFEGHGETIDDQSQWNDGNHNNTMVRPDRPSLTLESGEESGDYKYELDEEADLWTIDVYSLPENSSLELHAGGEQISLDEGTNTEETSKDDSFSLVLERDQGAEPPAVDAVKAEQEEKTGSCYSYTEGQTDMSCTSDSECQDEFGHASFCQGLTASCDCGDEACVEPQQEYYQETEGHIEPLDSTVILEVEDTENELLILGEYRNLQLTVEDYSFDWN